MLEKEKDLESMGDDHPPVANSSPLSFLALLNSLLKLPSPGLVGSSRSTSRWPLVHFEIVPLEISPGTVLYFVAYAGLKNEDNVAGPGRAGHYPQLLLAERPGHN